MSTSEIGNSGEKFPASVTIAPIKDETGEIVGDSKVARDLSDRTKNDDSRFQLAAIVDSAEDAIVSKDLNGIVRTWNQGACRMFGYVAEEMVGQSSLRLIPPELHYEEDEICERSGPEIALIITTQFGRKRVASELRFP